MRPLRRYGAVVSAAAVLALAGCGADDATVSAEGGGTGATTEDPDPTGVPPIDEPTEEPPIDEPTEEPPAGGDSETYAIGEAFEIGDYEVTITSITPDATEAVLAENPYNEDPVEGRQFMLISLEATYHGDETGMPGFDLRAQVLGADGDTFGGTGIGDDYCGVAPEELLFIPDLDPGATGSGNVCVSIPGDQISGGQILVSDSWDFQGEPVHIAID